MSDKKELQGLMTVTGLRVFPYGPEGHEVYKPGDEVAVFVASTMPALKAWLRGYAAGMRAEEKGGGE